MKPEKLLNFFELTKQEYLDLFPAMNVHVRTQDGGDTAIIDIDGYIGRDIIREWITGEKSPNTVENLKETLREISAGKIITNINSYGGDLNAGIVIKDMLQSKRARVVTNQMGFSASAATVVGQAGSTRRMSQTAFMLIHRSMIGLLGYYNLNTFLALAADLEVIDKSLVAMYAKRADIGEDEITELMDDGEGYGRWIDADEALEKGFIDKVYDPADEDDPDTDHLEAEPEDGQDVMDRETLKKALAFRSCSGLEDLLEGSLSGGEKPEDEEPDAGSHQTNDEDESSAAAEARRREAEALKIKQTEPWIN